MIATAVKYANYSSSRPADWLADSEEEERDRSRGGRTTRPLGTFQKSSSAASSRSFIFDSRGATAEVNGTGHRGEFSLAPRRTKRRAGSSSIETGRSEELRFSPSHIRRSGNRRAAAAAAAAAFFRRTLLATLTFR